MLETLNSTTVMRVLGCGPDHFRKQPTGFFLFLRIFFYFLTCGFFFKSVEFVTILLQFYILGFLVTSHVRFLLPD